MKKFYLSLVLIFSIFSSNASHLLGGEIYWECNGNGDYIFSLVLYRDCAGTILSTGTQTINTTASVGSISCAFVSQADISSSCWDPGQSLSCSNTSGTGNYGAFEKYTYRSAPIAITGNPPIGGYTFSYSVCCRPSSNSNSVTAAYHIEARMYENDPNACLSSPIFLNEPVAVLEQGKGSFSAMAFSSATDDSLSYSFVPANNGSGNTIVYNAGFSATAPLPDFTEDTLNGPNSIDSLTGLVEYDVVATGSSSGGSYIYAVKVESWRNGVLYSETTRDMIIYDRVSISGISNTNSAPSFSINSMNSSHPIVSNGTNRQINAYIGDSISFILTTTDNDTNSNGSFQQITVSGTGEYLDPIIGGSGLANMATLTAVGGQTGATNALVNTMRFDFQTPSNATRGSKYYFNFQASDDDCPIPARANIQLEILVLDPVSIQEDTVSICAGDSVQVTAFSSTSNYLWSPTNFMSSPTAANPYFYPTTSGYYFLTDPNNGQFVDSVYIKVNAIPQLTLTYQNAELIPLSSLSLDAHQWYYNSIPFSNALDTLAPFGSGVYYFDGSKDGCYGVSNAANVAAGSFKAVIDPNNGNVSNGAIPLNGSMGVDFEIQNPNYDNLKSINIAGLFIGKGKLNSSGSITVKLYDKQTQNELYSKDTILSSQGEIISLPANLQINSFQDYTLTISSVDSTVYIYSYENVSFPYNPNGEDILVKGAASGAAMLYPTSSSNEVVGFTMSFKLTIGLHEETEHKVDIYPNPAKDMVTIKVTEGSNEGSIEIRDISGKFMHKQSISDESIELNIENWTRGVYFITLIDNQDKQVFKFIKQ